MSEEKPWWERVKEKLVPVVEAKAPQETKEVVGQARAAAVVAEQRLSDGVSQTKQRVVPVLKAAAKGDPIIAADGVIAGINATKQDIETRVRQVAQGAKAGVRGLEALGEQAKLQVEAAAAGILQRTQKVPQQLEDAARTGVALEEATIGVRKRAEQLPKQVETTLRTGIALDEATIGIRKRAEQLPQQVETTIRTGITAAEVALPKVLNQATESLSSLGNSLLSGLDGMGAAVATAGQKTVEEARNESERLAKINALQAKHDGIAHDNLALFNANMEKSTAEAFGETIVVNDQGWGRTTANYAQAGLRNYLKTDLARR